MAAALRFALVFIAFACLCLFLKPPWWFPAGASAQSAVLDPEFRIAFLAIGVLFLTGQLLLAFVVGRRPSQRPNESAVRSWRGNWKLELAWIAVTAGVFFWFNVSGSRLWSQLMSREEPSSAVRIEVTGMQFQWYFRYPGADGSFGRTDAQKFARPSEGNPLGLDSADPAGNDDIVSSSLVLPVGHEADLTLKAQDVIHSLFIPAMRLKQDAVPGMDIHAHFTPTQIGTYEIVCSQLCGLGHYRMRATARVVSEAEFEAWLRSHGPASTAPGKTGP